MTCIQANAHTTCHSCEMHTTFHSYSTARLLFNLLPFLPNTRCRSHRHLGPALKTSIKEAKLFLIGTKSQGDAKNGPWIVDDETHSALPRSARWGSHKCQKLFERILCFLLNTNQIIIVSIIIYLIFIIILCLAGSYASCDMSCHLAQ